VAAGQCERILQVLTALEPRSPTEHLERQFVEALAELRCGQPEEAARKLEAMLLVKVPAFAYWQQRHLIHFQLGQALESSGRPEEAAAQYQEALSRAPNCRAAAERLAALGGGSTTQDVQQQSVEDRLWALTPKTFWQIDFSGRFQLLGTTMTPVRANAEQANGISDLGAVAANPDGLSAPSAEAEAPEAGWAPAFIANYYWIVLDDLDPALYDVTYRYLDAEGNVLFVDRKPLTPEASPGASSPPVSGIGVVCVHQSAVPLPLGTAREVQMQVRRAPRDKVPAETLAPDTGEPLMTLGLVASSNQGG
jgi:tetratricopeptide (TPR) repeat protein